MNISVVSLDGTGDPAADGCTASWLVSVHEEVHDPYAEDVWWAYDHYQLDASAAEGWKFDHFEWQWDSHGSDGSHYHRDRSYDGEPPYPDAIGKQGSYLYEGELHYGGIVETYTVSNCRAVFKKKEKEQSTISVSVTCVYGSNPRTEGGGTASPESDSKTADSGETSTFTFTATPDDGFRFSRWEDAGGSAIGTNATLTLSKIHTDEDQAISIYAVFARATGLILRDSSGTILRGSGGNILRDE